MTAILAIAGIFLLFMLLFAFNASDVDAMDILEQKQINHKRGLIIRILIGALVYALTCIAWVIAYRFYRVVSIWPVLLLIPMGWAWWTAWFRFLLNNMRGKDWRYLGKDADYDCFWLYRTFTGPDRVILIAHMPSIYYCDKYAFTIYRKTKDLVVYVDEYRAKVHRAGLIAYTFEAIVFASSAIALLCSA